MKKKGFTLVELLAVIAILAILVIMALPAVLRMYRQSRISSFQNEIRTVYRTAQSQFLGDSISLGSGQMIAYTNAGTSVSGVDVVKELDMMGNTNFKYYVLINVDGKVLNVRASNGTYSFSKQASDADHDLKIEDIDVETYNDVALDSDITTTICPTTEATYGSSSSGNSSNDSIITFVTRQVEGQITVGDELTIAGENFYVISSDTTNTKLLSKYDLNITSNSQTSSEQTESIFSNNSYWTDGTAYCTIVNPYNLNGGSYDGNPYPYVYDSNSSLYIYINAYTNKLETETGLNLTGKLMSYEEANNLNVNLRKDLNDSNYWLGSSNMMRGMEACPVDETNNQTGNTQTPQPVPLPQPAPLPDPGSCGIPTIWFVDDSGSMYYFIYDNGAPLVTASIRPIIIISTSAL